MKCRTFFHGMENEKKIYLIWRLQNTISVQRNKSTEFITPTLFKYSVDLFCHEVQFVVCYLKGDWIHLVDFYNGRQLL